MTVWRQVEYINKYRFQSSFFKVCITVFIEIEKLAGKKNFKFSFFFYFLYISDSFPLRQASSGGGGRCEHSGEQCRHHGDQAGDAIDAFSGTCLPRSYKNGQETLALKLEGTARYAGKLQELWPLAKATFVGPSGEKNTLSQ